MFSKLIIVVLIALVGRLSAQDVTSVTLQTIPYPGMTMTSTTSEFVPDPTPSPNTDFDVNCPDGTTKCYPGYEVGPSSQINTGCYLLSCSNVLKSSTPKCVTTERISLCPT